MFSSYTFLRLKFRDVKQNSEFKYINVINLNYIGNQGVHVEEYCTAALLGDNSEFSKPEFWCRSEYRDLSDPCVTGYH